MTLNSSDRPDPPEIIRLLNCMWSTQSWASAQLSRPLSSSIMNSCWRRDSAQTFGVGEVLGAHRQGQVHVVLQRAHQIGIAAGGEQRDVKGVVGFVDARTNPARRLWRDIAAAVQRAGRSSAAGAGRAIISAACRVRHFPTS